MEGSPGPEKQWPEPNDKGLPTHPFRPPGLEMMMGLGLFFSVLMLWSIARGLGMLLHPHVQAAMEEAPFADVAKAYEMHGDVFAYQAAVGGVMGTAILLLFVFLWKKSTGSSFLAMRTVAPALAVRWAGIFIACALVIELIVRNVPVLQDPFTPQVVGSVTRPLYFIVGVGLLGPLFEEFAFRGLFYGSLRYLLDKHVAIAVVSSVFTLMHMQYEWPVLFSQVLPMSILLGYVRSETNSIWPGVVLHALNNTGSFLIGHG